MLSEYGIQGNPHTPLTPYFFYAGLSKSFINKTNVAGNGIAWSHSFDASNAITTLTLISHINAGFAFTPGTFGAAARTNENWQSSQLLVLDLDNHDGAALALDDDFINRHAFYVGTTASHTKQHNKRRVLFLLDEKVTDRDVWERMQKALINHLSHLAPDIACSDPARLYFGNNAAKFVQRDVLLPSAVISEIASKHIIPAASVTITRAAPRPTAIKTSRRTGYINYRFKGVNWQSDFADAIRQQIGISAKTDSIGFFADRFASPFCNHEHDATAPGMVLHSERGYAYCHKCGSTHKLVELAEIYGVPYILEEANIPQSAVSNFSPAQVSQDAGDSGDNAPDIQDYEHAVFIPDRVVSERYISNLNTSELLLHPTILIKSPIGTGKTELSRRLIHAWEVQNGRQARVLAISHRQALSGDIARRLNLEDYRGIPKEYMSSVPRLSICYNSIPQLVRPQKTVPEYDFVIIDEHEQFHNHLGGNTFKGGESQNAYVILRQLVKQAGLFLALDAHMSDTSVLWAQSVRSVDIFCIQNDFAHERGTLNIHDSQDSLIRHAELLANENNGVVVIPTSSKATSKKLDQYFASRYGRDAVFTINSNNSNGFEAQDFIKTINESIHKLRIFIYSPSIGTGVDIHTPVRAVCGVMLEQPLAATDMHQMLGRCRTAQEVHVYVNSVQGAKETDWHEIYEQHRFNAHTTGIACDFDAHGVLAINDTQKSMLRLLSMLEAEHNRSANRLMDSFISYATGYGVNFISGECGGIKEEMIEIAQQIKSEEREMRLASDAVNYSDMEMHRRNGTITPAIRLGHERFVIEDSVGLTITEEIHDDLYQADDRKALRAFTDLLESDEYLQERDIREADKNYLLMHRSHRIMRKRLLGRFLSKLFDTTDVTSLDEIPLMTADEINRKIDTFIQDNQRELQTYLGYRCDQSQNSVPFARWLLSRIGLKLDNQQKMCDGNRQRYYFVDAQSLQKMSRYALARLNHVHSSIAQNTGINILEHKLSNLH